MNTEWEMNSVQFQAVFPAFRVSCQEYFLKWAPGSESTGKEEDDRRNDRLAKQSIDAHKILGKFLQ